jgi:hypothetical protein
MLKHLSQHSFLDQTDDGGNNGAGDAAARGLAKHGGYIKAASRSRSCQSRDQRSKEMAANPAAQSATDRIADRTKIDVLLRAARSIAAYGAGDGLNEQVCDNRHVFLL